MTQMDATFDQLVASFALPEAQTADWLAIGCSGTLHAEAIASVLALVGMSAHIDLGRAGWPATVEVDISSRAQGMRVLEVARELDPRAEAVRRRARESSVRLTARRAAEVYPDQRPPSASGVEAESSMEVMA